MCFLCRTQANNVFFLKKYFLSCNRNIVAMVLQNINKERKNKMTIDLHNHSNYSDGQYSPSKVIENAVRDGLSAVALADHDCV